MIFRTQLEKASGLRSSYRYRFGWKKGKLIDVVRFKSGAFVCPDMLVALKELNKQIMSRGGELRITDLRREWKTQEKARQDYLSGKKSAFVAKPDSSFHVSGRAVDIDIFNLNFPDSDLDWVEILWDIAIPIGFSPIIQFPDLHATEAWHFDYLGKDWSHAKDKVKYTELAKCSILDTGQWGEQEDKNKINNRFIQSQLIRMGFYSVGLVDGIMGPKTKSILQHLGLDPTLTQECLDYLKNKEKAI